MNEAALRRTREKWIPGLTNQETFAWDHSSFHQLLMRSFRGAVLYGWKMSSSWSVSSQYKFSTQPLKKWNGFKETTGRGIYRFRKRGFVFERLKLDVRVLGSNPIKESRQARLNVKPVETHCSNLEEVTDKQTLESHSPWREMSLEGLAC